MLKDVIVAFINRDSELALNVCKRDDEVDNLTYKTFKDIKKYMIENPSMINTLLVLMHTIKYYERIADQATNIAEELTFFVLKQNIKHSHLI